jgi:hypothetical protein
MQRPSEEFALVVRGANKVEIDLARELLSEAEIPVLVHGPDFDVAELGVEVHQQLRARDLYVPRELRGRALEALSSAWGQLDGDGHPIESPPEWDGA